MNSKRFIKIIKFLVDPNCVTVACLLWPTDPLKLSNMIKDDAPWQLKLTTILNHFILEKSNNSTWSYQFKYHVSTSWATLRINQNASKCQNRVKILHQNPHSRASRTSPTSHRVREGGGDGWELQYMDSSVVVETVSETSHLWWNNETIRFKSSLTSIII